MQDNSLHLGPVNIFLGAYFSLGVTLVIAEETFNLGKIEELKNILITEYA